MSRSCPPPCWTGVSFTSRRTSSAPTPTGPPILCPVMAMVSSPEALKSTGRCPKAWTASEWTGIPCARAAATISATGWTLPTSLLAHMTVIKATAAGSASISRCTASTGTTPSASTGSQTASAPSCFSSHSTVSSTAWCSTGEHRIRRRRGSASCRAQYSPLTARLSASVPPEVKITSDGWAPVAAAMVSRASSTTLRARRPEPCSDEGLPLRLSSWVSAARACARMGVVAAWSRYTGTPTFYMPACLRPSRPRGMAGADGRWDGARPAHRTEGRRTEGRRAHKRAGSSSVRPPVDSGAAERAVRIGGDAVVPVRAAVQHPLQQGQVQSAHRLRMALASKWNGQFPNAKPAASGSGR